MERPVQWLYYIPLYAFNINYYFKFESFIISNILLMQIVMMHTYTESILHF